MGILDNSSSESLLRSLSHDLKEPIRSIRTKINKIVEYAEETGKIAEKKTFVEIDVAIKDIGETIKSFRSEARSKRIGFEEIQIFMEDVLIGKINNYINNLSVHPTVKDNYIRKELKSINENSRRLKRRVDSILNFAKVNGKLKYITFGLHNEVDRVRQEMEDLIERKNALITCYGNVIFYGDQLKLAQVFQNIIQNSIKYSRQDERPIINVEIERIKPEKIAQLSDRFINTKYNPKFSYVYLIFSDNGQGIDSEDVYKVFDLFFKGDNEIDEGEDRSGIGLAIVKSVIESHEGTVWIESGKHKKGTEVHILMPHINSNGQNG